jgi:hypothetical protein
VTPAAEVAQESAWRTESITVSQVDLAAQTLVEIKNLVLYLCGSLVWV